MRQRQEGRRAAAGPRTPLAVDVREVGHRVLEQALAHLAPVPAARFQRGRRVYHLVVASTHAVRRRRALTAGPRAAARTSYLPTRSSILRSPCRPSKKARLEPGTTLEPSGAVTSGSSARDACFPPRWSAASSSFCDTRHRRVRARQRASRAVQGLHKGRCSPSHLTQRPLLRPLRELIAVPLASLHIDHAFLRSDQRESRSALGECMHPGTRHAHPCATLGAAGSKSEAFRSRHSSRCTTPSSSTF